MHSEALRQLARKQTAVVETIFLPGTQRWNVIDPLPATGNLGIELGVAAGSFSARMVRSGRFRLFYGVDVYGDGHNTQEYKKALREVGLESDYRLLRLTFDHARDLFPDRSFDFIYCDGYAHTGEEGGRTLIDWYGKLKPGGIMAGDDYDPEAWPLVVWAVHHVVAQLGVPLLITDRVSDEAYNRYRSWYFVKPDGPDAALQPCAPLMDVADLEKAKVAVARRNRAKTRAAKG
jgi:Methyltransferase domain